MIAAEREMQRRLHKRQRAWVLFWNTFWRIVFVGLIASFLALLEPRSPQAPTPTPRSSAAAADDCLQPGWIDQQIAAC